MAVTATPVFPQGINLTPTSFAPADTTTAKTIFTAGANGSKWDTLIASSTDTSARTFNIFIKRGGVSYLLFTVTIPLGAGNDGTIPAMDCLRSGLIPGLLFDAIGNRWLGLMSGDVIQAACTTTITTAKAVAFVAHGEDL